MITRQEVVVMWHTWCQFRGDEGEVGSTTLPLTSHEGPHGCHSPLSIQHPLSLIQDSWQKSRGVPRVLDEAALRGSGQGNDHYPGHCPA